jgi:hypothetical protein
MTNRWPLSGLIFSAERESKRESLEGVTGSRYPPVVKGRLAGVLKGAAEELVRVAARRVVADGPDREPSPFERRDDLDRSPRLLTGGLSCYRHCRHDGAGRSDSQDAISPCPES